MVIIPWWRRVCAAHFEHHFPVSVGDFVDFRSISPVGWVSPRSLASKCSHPVKNSRNSPDRRTVTGGERFFRIGLVIHTTQRIYSIGKWIIIFMDLFFPPKKKVRFGDVHLQLDFHLFPELFGGDARTRKIRPKSRPTIPRAAGIPANAANGRSDVQNPRGSPEERSGGRNLNC